MNRVYNFSAGPSMLPLEVLERAQKEMLCYGESGMSVMEMSHRTPEFEAILHGAEDALRKLMNIPANYKILFMQGGASTQFAMVPLNLYGKNMKADYVVTGQFAGKAVENFTVVKQAPASDNEIESISGATITSKAMANGVNACITYFQNVLEGGAN